MKNLNVFMLLLCLSLCAVTSSKSLLRKNSKTESKESKFFSLEEARRRRKLDNWGIEDCGFRLFDDDGKSSQDHIEYRGSKNIPNIAWDLEDDIKHIEIKNINTMGSCHFNIEIFGEADYTGPKKTFNYTVDAYKNKKIHYSKWNNDIKSIKVKITYKKDLSYGNYEIVAPHPIRRYVPFQKKHKFYFE